MERCMEDCSKDLLISGGYTLDDGIEIGGCTKENTDGLTQRCDGAGR